MTGKDSFGAFAKLDTSSGTVGYYSLHALQKAGLIDLDRTPFSIRILVENALRQSDGGPATPGDVERVAGWRPDGRPDREFPYMPGRVALQDFTGVPLHSGPCRNARRGSQVGCRPFDY